MSQVNLKGTPTSLSKEFVKVGSIAPDFTLVDQYLKDCSLHEFGRKKKILSIVPSLDTEVCLTSTKTLNAAAKHDKDLFVIIISADLPFAQKRICGLEHLDNIKTLSMMRDKNFAKDYGVLITSGPLAGICARAVIVLDEHNKVLYTELVPEITHEPDYHKALAAFKH